MGQWIHVDGVHMETRCVVCILPAHRGMHIERVSEIQIGHLRRVWRYILLPGESCASET